MSSQVWAYAWSTQEHANDLQLTALPQGTRLHDATRQCWPKGAAVGGFVPRMGAVFRRQSSFVVWLHLLRGRTRRKFLRALTSSAAPAAESIVMRLLQAILHYGHAGRPNDGVLKDGDMLLLDLGAEFMGCVWSH